MEKTTRKLNVPVYLKWIGWVLVVQFILINISAAFYAHKLTHIIDDPALRNRKPSQNIFVKTWRLFSGPRQARSFVSATPLFPFETVQLKTSTGISIESWYSAADSASKGVIILFHGITANKGMIIDEAGEFRNMGYDVMLVDFRGHGNSGGNTTTMGIRETEEVKLAYDFAARKNPRNIFLWGTSMGAVVISKAAGEDSLALAGLILEMPFQSMKTHLAARARALGFQGFPEKPFGFFVTCWISLERGVKGFKHRTTDYAAKIKIPVLMQWGNRDLYVTKPETEKIFASFASPSKKLVEYEGAGHESLLQFDPAKWRIETEKFLSSHTRP